MIAILKYTDCMQDGRNVFGVLAKNNVEIVKTKTNKFNIYPEITIRVNDKSELNKILYELNKACAYEVALMKVKSEEGFFDKIKRNFTK